ncbi:MAG: ParA family protein, partial [Gammaproteobacteria bacterium]|nr:ParA family protein [Gammaproteobacteria bacterium]
IGQVHNFLRRQNFNDVEVLPFFSMVDLRKNLHREMLDYPPTEIGPMLQSWIPYASEVERMTLRRAPLVSFSPGGRAGLAYDALWAEIRDRLRWR